MSGEVGKTPPTIEYRLAGEWAHLGPLTEAQVRELIARRKASNATLATIGDDPTLTPLGEISAFADCFVTKLLPPPSAGAPASQLSARTGSALIVAEARSKPRRALPRWALAATAAAVVYGLTQLYSHFPGEPLPDCDSPAAIESTLKALKPQHADFVSAATLRDIRTLSSGQRERSCAASLVSTSGDRPAVALEYRIIMEDKAIRTEVTKADFPSAKPPTPSTPQKPHAAPTGVPDVEACHLKGEPDQVIAACSRLLRATRSTAFCAETRSEAVASRTTGAATMIARSPISLNPFGSPPTRPASMATRPTSIISSAIILAPSPATTRR